VEKYRKHSKVETKDLTSVLKITLKTLFGLETVLKEELEELGYSDAQVLNRAVQIEGEWKDVYYLNLHCRCAIAVLVEVASFRIKDEDDLYKQAKKIDWTSYFDVDKTFAIKGAVISNFFNHTQFPYLVVKDAVADVFRDKVGKRPDVNIKKPQVLFDLYINNDWVTISMNTSGLPLYQRGYREDVGDAPLNEVLAAGLLRLAKWDKKTPLIDPFCGSGTILIEAALAAAGIPSTIERQHYAFKNFSNYDAELWEGIYKEASDHVRSVKSLPVMLLGSDIDSEMVLKARRNLRRFNIGRFVEIKTASFDEIKNLELEAGIMITNPPYGERMGKDIPELYANIGDWMKTELKGFDCWMITSSEEGLKSVGLKPDAKIKLFNGSLECSYRKFSIYSGSKREKFQVKED
jgi:putative N6-adenine-specific DNA methylase